MKRVLAILLLLFCVFSATIPLHAAEKGQLVQLLSETYHPERYTTDTYAAYQTAVNQAIVVYENQNATQEQIDKACAQLQSAKEALKLILEKETLMYYVEQLESLIYSINQVMSDETLQQLISTRDEFLALYGKETVTEEELTAAETKFTQVKELAESSREVEEFSPEHPAEDVIVPDDPEEDPQRANRITQFRITVVIVGGIFLILGIAATILYFKPPKFLK